MKDKDISAHEKALEYRYKSAKQAYKNGDENTAYKNYNALSKEGYKDSESKFVALEKARVKNTKIGEVIPFAHMDWRVLDKKRRQKYFCSKIMLSVQHHLMKKGRM